MRTRAGATQGTQNVPEPFTRSPSRAPNTPGHQFSLLNTCIPFPISPLLHGRGNGRHTHIRIEDGATPTQQAPSMRCQVFVFFPASRQITFVSLLLLLLLLAVGRYGCRAPASVVSHCPEPLVWSGPPPSLPLLPAALPSRMNPMCGSIDKEKETSARLLPLLLLLRVLPPALRQELVHVLEEFERDPHKGQPA